MIFRTIRPSAGKSPDTAGAAQEGVWYTIESGNTLAAVVNQDRQVRSKALRFFLPVPNHRHRTSQQRRPARIRVPFALDVDGEWREITRHITASHAPFDLLQLRPATPEQLQTSMARFRDGLAVAEHAYGAQSLEVGEGLSRLATALYAANSPAFACGSRGESPWLTKLTASAACEL
jgi:hypothetical protein